MRSLSAPTFIAGIDFSDHSSYWNEGMSAVMVTDTAFYRNPRYHTAEDLPDTLDHGRMAEVVRGLLSAIHGIAGRLVSPRLAGGGGQAGPAAAAGLTVGSGNVPLFVTINAGAEVARWDGDER